jgi:hypothetical protein
MLPTGDYSDSEEEDYPEQNVRATYAKAKFARIQPSIQRQTVQMGIEPRPIRSRAGQVINSTHKRLIDLAIDSWQDDEDRGPAALHCAPGPALDRRPELRVGSATGAAGAASAAHRSYWRVFNRDMRLMGEWQVRVYQLY